MQDIAAAFTHGNAGCTPSSCYDGETEAATALPFTTDTQRTHVVFRSSK